MDFRLLQIPDPYLLEIKDSNARIKKTKSKLTAPNLRTLINCVENRGENNVRKITENFPGILFIDIFFKPNPFFNYQISDSVKRGGGGTKISWPVR